MADLVLTSLTQAVQTLVPTRSCLASSEIQSPGLLARSEKLAHKKCLLCTVNTASGFYDCGQVHIVIRMYASLVWRVAAGTPQRARSHGRTPP